MRHPLPVVILIAIVVCLATSAELRSEVVGETKISSLNGLPFTLLDDGDLFGSNIAQIGDLDSDGIDDLAVGALYDDDGGTDRGAVWILFLTANATVKSYQKISNTEGGFTGTLLDGDEFGAVVTKLGDVDNDGVGDIAVTASGDDAQFNNGGAVWIIFLNADGTVKSHTKLQDNLNGFPLRSKHGFLGSGLAELGDLDSDGVPDVAIGDKYGGANDQGSVWITFLNADGTVKGLYEITPGVPGFNPAIPIPAQFGETLAYLGDLSSDGTIEIAASAAFLGNGHVFVISLNSDGTVAGYTLILPTSIDIRYFGRGLAGIGDLDGDGVTELAIGSSLDTQSTDEGAVYLTFLNSSGGVKSMVRIGDGDGGFTGTLDSGDRFGRSVGAFGDFDGDSVFDLLVTAQLDDDGGSDRGAVWALYLNTDGTVKGYDKISSTQGNFTDGLSDGDSFGTGVVSIGDLDGDGVTDFAVGAGLDNDGGGNRGAVWILFMNADGSVKDHTKISSGNGGFAGTLANNDRFGSDLDVIGDLDNDGVVDLAVAATKDADGGGAAGAVWILFLNADGTVKNQQKISATAGGGLPVTANDELGWSVTAMGLLDGDAVPDIAVGAPLDDDGAGDAGAVYVIFLNTDGTMKGFQKISRTSGGFTGLVSAGDLFGTGASSIGDLDGDGVTDLAVGAAFDREGAVWVLFLNSNGTVKSHQKIDATNGGLTGPIDLGDEFGRSVASAGDLDLNGTMDIVVGANFDDDGGANRGAAWVLYLNADGTVRFDEKISDLAGGFGGVLDNDDRFATDVAGIGDFDGDGFGDILVGARNDDDGGTNRGAAWLLSYRTVVGPPACPEPPQPGIQRFVAVNQDKPVTHQPDYIPPARATSSGSGTTYELHKENFDGGHAWVAGAGTDPDYYDVTPQLESGLTLVQEDASNPNLSSVWTFYTGSTVDYSCGGFPAQTAVPFVNAMGQRLRTEIVSPMIDWNTDLSNVTVPSTATDAYLEFDVYMDLPLDNLVFYFYRVRWFDATMTPIITSTSDANGWMPDLNGLTPAPSVDIFYGENKEWDTHTASIGALVPTTPAPAYVQVAIGVWDACADWCGILGSGACHSHAPLVDNVLVTRFDPPALWTVNGADLFQDNFSTDGTTTGTVRIDMARDIATSGAVRPGDSIAVSVAEPLNGLGIDPTWGGAAVYLHVSEDGAKAGDAISGDLGRFPVVSSGGGWTVLRMDSVYCDPAQLTVVPDRFCVDLNDNLFVPGDTIDYYFSATDMLGQPSYWNEFTGVGVSESHAREFAMEVTCLPANGLGGGDVLYVDAVDGGGPHTFYEWAFSLIDAKLADRYDMRGPSQMVNNGLSTRVRNVGNQLHAAYRKIIWDSGDLPVGTIPDGSGLHRGDDFDILFQFLDQSPDDSGLFIAGDDVASEWDNSVSPNAAALRTYMTYSLVDGDHRNVSEPVSPYVIGVPGPFGFDHIIGPDTVVAYGGGTYLNAFDVIVPAGGANLSMSYSGDLAHGALVSQESVNNLGNAVRVMLSGFSLNFLREDRHVATLDRAHHLYDILTWLNNIVSPPVDVATPGIETRLAQNYPNPFNPTTTITYSLAEQVDVDLSVFDVAGRRVRRLAADTAEPGAHTVTWDGRNDAGTKVSSGVYFYRLVAGDFHDTRKMVLLK